MQCRAHHEHGKKVQKKAAEIGLPKPMTCFSNGLYSLVTLSAKARASAKFRLLLELLDFLLGSVSQNWASPGKA